MTYVYNLSPKALGITWHQWLSMGGCGIPNDSAAPQRLGPVAYWKKNGVTLGQIAQVCPYTGRSLARFAVEHLSRKELSDSYNQEEK